MNRRHENLAVVLLNGIADWVQDDRAWVRALRGWGLLVGVGVVIHVIRTW